MLKDHLVAAPQRVSADRRQGRLIAVLLALGLIASTSSCSWVFVRGPDESIPVSQPVSCTTSFTWPGVDVALMLVNLITGTVVGASGEPGPAIGFTSWSLVHALSAYSGVKRTERCQEAKMLRQQVAQDPGGAPSPGEWGAPPAPDPAAAAPAPAPGPARGTEGGVCYGNGTCNDGLTCDGGVCGRI